MKSYTYPAVFYYDEEYNDYAVEFSDICIYAEGDTMEEAYKNAQEYLVAYLDCCQELGVEPNTPNTYKAIENEHPNGKTMLVTVDYEEKSFSNNKEKVQETYTNLNDNILEDLEGEEQEEKSILEEVERFQQEREKTIKRPVDDDDDGDDFGLPEID